MKRTLATALALAAAFSSGCSALAPAPAAPAPARPTAAALAASASASEGAIRFLEERVRRDPDDFVACNKLAGYYLQRVRETGSLDFLTLAGRAADASLAAMPAEQNAGGLAAKCQVEFASHEFAAARDHALELARLDPGKPYPYETLGDALLELGDYDGADAAFSRVTSMGGAGVSLDTRLARVAILRGDPERAERLFASALERSTASPEARREPIAWCQWQLGETAFARGDYAEAERRYRDALETFPDYFRALASLGRVRAAAGDVAGAIEYTERATRLLPDPTFVAALGDLYALAGRDADARAQYALVEQIARVGAAGGALYSRQLALFYADHGTNAEAAYAGATADYAVRHDVYGADALAWAALAAGRVDEARRAIGEALRLGTRDARLLYHAGMIARAAGDAAAARDYLSRALALSPRFDPLQAPRARAALDELAKG